MAMETGYEGYKINYNVDMPEMMGVISPETAEVTPDLSKPVMNVDSLFNLARYLEKNQFSAGFPEVTVIPDVLRNVGKFVNERKRMKYEHQEFEKKLKFVSDGVEKQYIVAMTKLNKETEIRLAQINGNTKQQILNIRKYYELQTEKLQKQYELEREQMNRYYWNIAEERKEQARRFDKMLKLAVIERRKAERSVKEADELCMYLKKKFYNNTITREEREHYMELMKFRNDALLGMANIVPKFAAQFK